MIPLPLKYLVLLLLRKHLFVNDFIFILKIYQIRIFAILFCIHKYKKVFIDNKYCIQI